MTEENHGNVENSNEECADVEDDFSPKDISNGTKEECSNNETNDAESENVEPVTTCSEHHNI